MSQKGKCSINSDGSVCLSDILNSFNSCIKEEHAWALCYQISKYYLESLAAKNNNPHIHNITEVQHVFLKSDGTIHENTCLAKDRPRELLRCEKDVVAGIGVVIYATLDHEINEGDEVIISNELEQLITDMISDDLNSISQTHHETDDEGIERDSEEHFEAGSSKCNEEQSRVTLAEVIGRCEAHLGTLTKAQAEAHYKAVVRALVAEAIELSTFLEKVAQGTISLPSSSTSSNLDQLKFTDWAKFWVQVMGELRTVFIIGVKLKKVNYSKAPIEYELTPYEILMKDIRNCKYNLRKIMINGDIPNRVSKDAHAIILDFIRSRPPLRKAADRKLPPQPRIVLTPREQLLLSIKKGRKLRPVPMPRTSYRYNADRENPKPAGRRLIKVDYSQFDDDDDDEPSMAETPDSSEPGLWSSEYQQICDGTLDAYDLATQVGMRRNTVGVTEIPAGCYSVPQSRPGSRQSCNSTESDTIPMEPEVARQIQHELTNSDGCWQDSISLDDRLSLTLSEIVHIRTVLTKAEVEALPTEGRVRHDVESRKVCFLCLKTRFGIFGPWGQRCSLCKRTVCTKCYSKMNIPMEHFSTIPVVLLSPSMMCTPEDEHRDSLTKTFMNKMNTGTQSRASSPDVTRSPSGLMCSSTISDPGFTGPAPALTRFRAGAVAVGRTSKAVDRMKGSQMVVCHDCKIMVLQIIKSARANRSAIRNKTLQTLTLNLSPVF